MFEGAGAGPLPSYAFAPDPYPTKSISDANPAGLETVRTAVLFRSATLPAVVASASVPTTSAAGSGAPFAPPDASRMSTYPPGGTLTFPSGVAAHPADVAGAYCTDHPFKFTAVLPRLNISM